MNLQELSASIQHSTTTIRGKEIQIRALRDAEGAQLSRVFPPPFPPMGPAFNKGSLHPPVENREDPQYKREFESWWQRRARMVIGICTGLARGYERNMPDDRLKAVMEECEVAISEAMTHKEIFRLSEEISGLLDERAHEKIRANLIVNAYGVDAPSVEPPEPLPREYFKTRTAVVLTLCREYGIDPRTLDDFEPGLMAVLISDYRIRQQESLRAQQPSGA